MTTETQAYLDGNIELADALARIAELEAEVEALENAAADVVTLGSWENSDDQIAEAILCNEYEFTEDGDRV